MACGLDVFGVEQGIVVGRLKGSVEGENAVVHDGA